MPKVLEQEKKSTKSTGLVDNIEALNNLLDRVKKAQEEYSKFSQEDVDRIFKAAATAADKMRIPLARMAVEDTGMGVLEDKIIKNHFASEYIYNKYRDTKTCGVIERDESKGTMRIAEPIGVIAAVIPTTYLVPLQHIRSHTSTIAEERTRLRHTLQFLFAHRTREVAPYIGQFRSITVHLKNGRFLHFG